MSESPSIARPFDEGEYLFRRRTAAAMADIHLEGQLLARQARAAKEQWLDTQARMTRAWEKITLRRWSTSETTSADAGDVSLRQEREAHDQTRLVLERELTRGRRLEDEVLAIQDQERARMGRELHDGICQSMAAVTFMLETHVRQLEALEPGSKPARSARQMREMFAQTIQEMRGLSHELSGFETNARDGSLCTALQVMAEHLNASESVRCEVVCPGSLALDNVKAAHLYRIAQEAVSNAMRHGRAEHVEIRLEPVNGQWRFSITDDGTGVPEEGASNGSDGLGMRSMKYRAAVIGGAVEVKRANMTGDRPGTVVSCAFP